MVEDVDDHGGEDEHLHRREAHLAPPADVVADEVARAPEQLPDGERHRPRAHAPEVHDALADAVPCDGPYAVALSAAGTVVAREGPSAVLADVLFVAHSEAPCLLLSPPELPVAFTKTHGSFLSSER